MISSMTQLKNIEKKLQDQFKNEKLLLDAISTISTHTDLLNVLESSMNAAKKIADCDRCTLFLNDTVTNELWSRVAQGLDRNTEIRFPNNIGLAGNCFTTGETINIPDAYSDHRFNQEFDKKNNYKTNTVLCYCLINNKGERLGVFQLLNKKNGFFNISDELRLNALSIHITNAINTAQLIENILYEKELNETILNSTHTNIFIINYDYNIEYYNHIAAGLLQYNIDRLVSLMPIIKKNNWLLTNINKCRQNNKLISLRNITLIIDERKLFVNITISLIGVNILLNIENVTEEMLFQDALSKYISSDAINELIDNGQIKLGGTLQTVSVMFSDIRQFTLLSEKLNNPKAVVSFLNDHFTNMNEIITNHNGGIFNYIGDAIMVVFGISNKSHYTAEDNSLLAAIDMQLKVIKMKKHFYKKYNHKLDIGIGINSGPVIVGNIGASTSMAYTVIGDNVNLAARLESLTKQYGCKIIISENFKNKLTKQYHLRLLDHVIVAGKTKPIKIYQVYLTKPKFNIQEYENALFHYKNKQWDSAIFILNKLKLNDFASNLLYKRCLTLKKENPKNWDGVWKYNKKIQ